MEHGLDRLGSEHVGRVFQEEGKTLSKLQLNDIYFLQNSSPGR